jgi:hypothetical protein
MALPSDLAFGDLSCSDTDCDLAFGDLHAFSAGDAGFFLPPAVDGPLGSLPGPPPPRRRRRLAGEADAGKSRGNYNCSKCGQPKRGHGAWLQQPHYVCVGDARLAQLRGYTSVRRRRSVCAGTDTLARPIRRSVRVPRRASRGARQAGAAECYARASLLFVTLATRFARRAVVDGLTPRSARPVAPRLSKARVSLTCLLIAPNARASACTPAFLHRRCDLPPCSPFPAQSASP